MTYCLTAFFDDKASRDASVSTIELCDTTFGEIVIDAPEESGELRLYHEASQPLQRVRDALVSCPDAANTRPVHLVLEALAPRNWVALSQAALPPVCLGRLFIHGAHDRKRVPRVAIGLEIEAAEAFGTGHHETTRAALMAMMWRARQWPPKRVLDFGCGSGLLGLAAVKLYKAKALLIDCDERAISVARTNGLRARCASQLAFARRHDPPPTGSFDLVFANIHRSVLLQEARGLARMITKDPSRKGGFLILSGVLEPDASALVATYRHWGLVKRLEIRLGGWLCLGLSRA